MSLKTRLLRGVIRARPVLRRLDTPILPGAGRALKHKVLKNLRKVVQAGRRARGPVVLPPAEHIPPPPIGKIRKLPVGIPSLGTKVTKARRVIPPRGVVQKVTRGARLKVARAAMRQGPGARRAYLFSKAAGRHVAAQLPKRTWKQHVGKVIGRAIGVDPFVQTAYRIRGVAKDAGVLTHALARTAKEKVPARLQDIKIARTMAAQAQRIRHARVAAPLGQPWRARFPMPSDRIRRPA